MTFVICGVFICNAGLAGTAQSETHPNQLCRRRNMSNNLPSLLFVDAMVGATAYTHPLHEASAVQLSTAAMEHVRRAQVDIYTSHNDHAMWAIREARRVLNASSNGDISETLAALAEASWFTRHNDFVRAEEALETALAHMRALSGQNVNPS